MLSSISIAAALALTGLSNAAPLSSNSTCDQSSVTTTRANYTIQANDTIFSIAAAVKGGACDIARYNKLADAEMLTTGMTILIPEQLCEPDNSSCILTEIDTQNDCVLGGPHSYLTIATDTAESIALKKFHVTLDTITSGLMTAPGTTLNTSAAITVGSQIKVPQCDPSYCIVKPLHFLYGTYKDLAEMAGTTPGQIFAFNPGYNVSTDGPGTGPVLTVPYNCTLESGNYTVES